MHRMIWLLSPPPPPVSKLDWRTQEDWERETTGVEEEWVGEEPNQESLVHKSFSTLWKSNNPNTVKWSSRISSAWAVLLDFYLVKKVSAERSFYAVHVGCMASMQVSSSSQLVPKPLENVWSLVLHPIGPGASNSAQTLPQVLSVFPHPFLSHARSLLSKSWEPTRRMSTSVPRTTFQFPSRRSAECSGRKEQFSLPFRPTIKEKEKCRRPPCMMSLNGSSGLLVSDIGYPSCFFLSLSSLCVVGRKRLCL
jgi:hypothetical protein